MRTAPRIRTVQDYFIVLTEHNIEELSDFVYYFFSLPKFRTVQEQRASNVGKTNLNMFFSTKVHNIEQFRKSLVVTSLCLLSDLIHSVALRTYISVIAIEFQ